MWASAFLYATGFSIVCYFIDSELSARYDVLVNTVNFFADASIACTFGMFCVVYAGILSYGLRRKLIGSGLIMLILIWLFTPLASYRHINYEGYPGLLMVIFQFFSLISGASQLIIAHYKEKDPYKKIERSLTNLLLLPTMAWIFLCYLLYSAGINLWDYNTITVLVFLFIFITIGVKKGVLGVKFRIEQFKADAALQSLQSSTSLLNHTVKNEIGKIDILLHQLNLTLQDTQEPGLIGDLRQNEMKEMIGMASESVDHIQSMMSRIQDKVQDIHVQLQRVDFRNIVGQCLEGMERIIGSQVSVQRNLEHVPDIYCDPVHMKELISNILSNAVEAMDRGGVITVNLFETRGEVVLQIEDTGKGIPNESISMIFDPFYSTKKTKSHYGLGLFYCKNVMMKHNGTIHVDSLPGRGTCFDIRLNK